MFEQFGHNVYFLAVFFGTFAFQYFLGNRLNWIFSTTTIDKLEWANCILTGSSVLFASAVLKLLPPKIVDLIASKLPDSLVNEDRTVENKTLQVWDKMNQLPVTGRRN